MQSVHASLKSTAVAPDGNPISSPPSKSNDTSAGHYATVPHLLIHVLPSNNGTCIPVVTHHPFDLTHRQHDNSCSSVTIHTHTALPHLPQHMAMFHHNPYACRQDDHHHTSAPHHLTSTISAPPASPAATATTSSRPTTVVPAITLPSACHAAKRQPMSLTGVAAVEDPSDHRIEVTPSVYASAFDPIHALRIIVSHEVCLRTRGLRKGQAFVPLCSLFLLSAKDMANKSSHTSAPHDAHEENEEPPEGVPQNGCRQRHLCRQLHVAPEFVAAARAAAALRPACCLGHEPTAREVAVTTQGQVQTFCVRPCGAAAAFGGGGVSLGPKPPSALSSGQRYTVVVVSGCSVGDEAPETSIKLEPTQLLTTRLLTSLLADAAVVSDGTDSDAVVIRVPRDNVCGHHLNGHCKFADDCRFLHGCREMLRPKVVHCEHPQQRSRHDSLSGSTSPSSGSVPSTPGPSTATNSVTMFHETIEAAGGSSPPSCCIHPHHPHQQHQHQQHQHQQQQLTAAVSAVTPLHSSIAVVQQPAPSYVWSHNPHRSPFKTYYVRH